ncbi:glycosyltransferase [Kamptonema sp. UHCC 0994]|uniref:glycosyltransferase family 2 protein n=1 Tax=Kamptonema sp. UHCC 0994 TaxID=3031329 RepID=UPI0023B9948E|nr:glycosyltransferase [Kamptonema sp. UHCC 0994]MDF0551922.1 glycosyltransferase [Kamptonema sp. UHCC 0994]
MLNKIKVTDIELSQGIATIEGLENYDELQGLVRLFGTPIGYVKVPVKAGKVTDQTLSQIILEQHNNQIISQLLHNGLATPATKSSGWRFEDLLTLSPPEYKGSLPLVSVAICFSDRISDLTITLNSLKHLDYPYLDILVVDNTPDGKAEIVVTTQYPHLRYIRELCPGIDWARNRAILEAKGDIIAYTNSGVLVDSEWVKALVKVFAEDANVMAVTGLVTPAELETESQILFEKNGGLSRGFETKHYQIAPEGKMPPAFLCSPEMFGTGFNMAFRRSIFTEIGYFNPALDADADVQGNGDLEMFLRLIKEGHSLVYEPSALVRHQECRSYNEMRAHSKNNAGICSALLCSAINYPDERLPIFRMGLVKTVAHLVNFLRSLFKANPSSVDLVLAEIEDWLISPINYLKAREKTAEILVEKGFSLIKTPEKADPQPTRKPKGSRAVRVLELNQQIEAIADATDYANTRIFVTRNGSAIGYIDIANYYQSISISRLQAALVEKFGLTLLEPDADANIDFLKADAIAALIQQYEGKRKKEEGIETEGLPANISVSVVVGTCDRPEDLRKCLLSLMAQTSRQIRPVEIIVVDNRPETRSASRVLVEFPDVEFIKEERSGASYARNAGIVVSTGDIVVTTDDDTIIPPDWLEKLIAPFARPEVMAVTGNVLPAELTARSQRLFEGYGGGGLSRGYKQFEGNREWFDSFRLHSVPTWLFGGTANSAFRANIFCYPEIGLMDEALGPGMPSGVGEDTYLFYKIMKAGHTIVYEPSAFVWHTHRRDIADLGRQLHNYSKGGVSYHLTTLINDGDLRAIFGILLEMPKWYAGRIIKRILGWTDDPILIILKEIIGYLAAPWSLWQSRLRVNREGFSSPYIPVEQRTTTSSELK